MPGAALEREVARGYLPQPMLSLFDEQFVRSNDLIQEYVARQALAVFVSTRLAAACESEASVQDAMQRAGLRGEVARVPSTWLCEVLAHRGWLQRAHRGEGSASYRVATPLPHLECQQIADVQEQHDARALPSYRIVALAAELYGPVLRGEI